MAVTTWNTAPDYDGWGPDSSWSCADWIQWHKLLKEHFGKEKAKILWEYAFSKQTFGASALDCRTFNSSFRSYMTEEGLDPFQNSGIFEPVLKGYGAASDIFNSITDGIGGIFGGKTGKVVGTAVVLAAVGFLAYKGFQAYRMIKK